MKLNKDSDIEILDANNQKRYNADGNPLSVDSAVEEFLTKNPHFQKAGQSGSGSEGKIGGSTTSSLKDLQGMSQEDIANMMSTPDGLERYRKIRANKRAKSIKLG